MKPRVRPPSRARSALLPRLALSALSALSAAFAGCAGPPEARPPDPEPAAARTAPTNSSPSQAIASASPAAKAAPSSPPPPVTPPPPPPCARIGWIDACSKRGGVASLTSAPLDTEALAAWYSSRGAKPPANEIEPVCREITVGPQREAALFCERIHHETRGQPESPLHTFRVVWLVSVRTARARRAVTLLEAPTHVDLLDKEELEDGPLFELELSDVDGSAPLSEITLREPKEGACAEAAATLKGHKDSARASNDAVMTAWARIDEEIRARMCAAAGTYVWRKDTFARAPVQAGAAAKADRRPDR